HACTPPTRPARKRIAGRVPGGRLRPPAPRPEPAPRPHAHTASPSAARATRSFTTLDNCQGNLLQLSVTVGSPGYPGMSRVDGRGDSSPLALRKGDALFVWTLAIRRDGLRMRATIRSFLILALAASLAEAQASEPPEYEVYAVRYAKLLGFKVANLVQGADPGRELDIAMTVWVLKGPDGRTILVDAGFYRPPYINRNVADYTRPDKALKPLGIAPEQVTDVIVTHMHWDHADGVDLFPKARVWIQKDEYDYYTREARQPGGDHKDPAPGYVLAMLKLDGEGRVSLVDGDAKEIIPGVTVYTGGRHTFASQYVGVNTRTGRVVIASDNLYLYENLDKHVPIAQTFDAKAKLAAQDRMKRLAPSPRLLSPGHDPQGFDRV